MGSPSVKGHYCNPSQTATAMQSNTPELKQSMSTTSLHTI